MITDDKMLNGQLVSCESDKGWAGKKRLKFILYCLSFRYICRI